MTMNHDPSAADTTIDHAGATGSARFDDHAATDADAHGHGHDGEDLGPLDVRAWGAGLLGTILGLVVAYTLVIATRPPV